MKGLFQKHVLIGFLRDEALQKFVRERFLFRNAKLIPFVMQNLWGGGIRLSRQADSFLASYAYVWGMENA